MTTTIRSVSTRYRQLPLSYSPGLTTPQRRMFFAVERGHAVREHLLLRVPGVSEATGSEDLEDQPLDFIGLDGLYDFIGHSISIHDIKSTFPLDACTNVHYPSVMIKSNPVRPMRLQG